MMGSLQREPAGGDVSWQLETVVAAGSWRQRWQLVVAGAGLGSRG